jgi:hypothetical protein
MSKPQSIMKPFKLKPPLLILTAAALALSLCSLFSAETATWGGGDGRWIIAENWEDEVLPINGIPVGATYNVIIGGGEPATVSAPPPTTASSVEPSSIPPEDRSSSQDRPR